MKDLQKYCDNLKEDIVYEEITAYIKSGDKEGFLNVDFSNNDMKVILCEEISMVGSFSTKENLLNFLKELNFVYDEINFIKMKSVEKVRYNLI